MIDTTPPAASFLGLPAKLRLEIYECVFWEERGSDIDLLANPLSRNRGICSASRLIRCESLPLHLAISKDLVPRRGALPKKLYEKAREDYWAWEFLRQHGNTDAGMEVFGSQQSAVARYCENHDALREVLRIDRGAPYPGIHCLHSCGCKNGDECDHLYHFVDICRDCRRAYASACWYIVNPNKVPMLVKDDGSGDLMGEGSEAEQWSAGRVWEDANYNRDGRCHPDFLQEWWGFELKRQRLVDRRCCISDTASTKYSEIHDLERWMANPSNNTNDSVQKVCKDMDAFEQSSFSDELVIISNSEQKYFRDQSMGWRAEAKRRLMAKKRLGATSRAQDV